MNTNDEQFETNINIPCEAGDRFCFINPDTLETEDVFAEINGKSSEICAKFDALSPVIVCKYRNE